MGLLLIGFLLWAVAVAADEGAAPSSSSSPPPPADAASQATPSEEPPSIQVEPTGTEASPETISAEDAADLMPPELLPRRLLEYSTLFPLLSPGRVPVDDVVDVLIAVHSRAPQNLNISIVRGYMYAPYDAKVFFQNFTGFVYNQILPAGESVSVAYRFRVDPYFEPHEYGFLFAVIFEDEEGSQFVNFAFNKTLEVYEPQVESDFADYLTKLAFVGGASLVGYLLYVAFSGPSGSAKAPKKKKPASESKSESSANDFVPETVKKFQRESSR